MNGSSSSSDPANAAAPGPGAAVVNAKAILSNGGAASGQSGTNGSGPASAAAAAATGGATATATNAPPPTIRAPVPGDVAASTTAASAGGGPASSTAPSTAAEAAAAARSPRPSPRPKKRQRSSASGTPPPPPVHASVRNSDDESDSANNQNPDGGGGESDLRDAFYLRHQNKALASELRQYKRQIDVLVAERDYRRDRCDEAREGVDQLGEIWAEVEGAVGTALVAMDLPGAASVKEEASGGVISEGGRGGSSSRIDLGGGGVGGAGGSPFPPSTGSGDRTETVPALVASLVRLAETPSVLPEAARIKTEAGGGREAKVEGEGVGDPSAMEVEDAVDETAVAAAGKDADLVKADLTQLSRSVAAVSDRAEKLRSALIPLLRAALSSASTTSADGNLLEPAALRRDVVALQNQLGEKDSKIAEVTYARDEAARGEKRVRRGLYRLASGRMKLSDVIKAVEMEDGSALFEEFAKEEAAMATSSMLSSPVATVSSSVPLSGTDDGPVDSAEVGQLRKRLQDLEEVADSRENRISGLLMEREDYIKQINDLSLAKADTHTKSISIDDVKRSDLHTEMSAKLAKLEAHSTQLQKAFDDINERWAKAKGDLDLARKTIKDMEDAHVKRLEEISTAGIFSEKGDVADTGDAQSNGDAASDKVYLSDAKKIVELEHKLNQALENVRQAETVRESLAEANRINETISAKLDEYQAKNAALVQAKAAARAAELETGSTAATTSIQNDKVVEKLQKEHRKMRKELAAALQSKDNARAKQERAERERDALMKTNARLLAQSTEKDEMNARSLSTILHLNQMSEQLSHEKELLEQKAKAAEQLALSSRLAANAKERAEEEEAKDEESKAKESLAAKAKIDSLISEKEEVNSKLVQSQAQVAAIMKDLDVAKARCADLAKESTAAEEEKSRLMDSVAIAKKEAAEASKQAAQACAHMASPAGRKGGVNSEFTMEQMETQVKVLKGRLACNVCNERDKEVILLRCRHMFCRPCVDKNIKNRSRKCPGCGQRFDMKDVGDVWL